MAGKKNRLKERRKHERYKVQDGILAMLGPGREKYGPIIDISKGGLAFQHRGGRPGVSVELSELSLLFDEKNVKFNNMPLKFNTETISDIKIKNENNQKVPRKIRCSVQFTQLTYHQKLCIDTLIMSQIEQNMQDAQVHDQV